MQLSNIIKKKSFADKIDEIDKVNIHNTYLNQDQGLIKEKYPSISIIIPIYNEENSIEDVINRIPNFHDYEIIIVDDGSTDNSIKRVKEIPNKNIEVIQHEYNLGYGAAIQTGIKSANGDILITLDSDGQHNPQEITKIIKPLIEDKSDIVIGSRYLGTCNYRIPLYTRLGEYFINLALYLLYRKKINNNQSGFRAIKNSSMKSFIFSYKNKGMAFSTEFLLKALENKKHIIEVPISIHPRKYGNSNVNLFKILRSIISIFFHYGLKKLIPIKKKK